MSYDDASTTPVPGFRPATAAAGAALPASAPSRFPLGLLLGGLGGILLTALAVLAIWLIGTAGSSLRALPDELGEFRAEELIVADAGGQPREYPYEEATAKLSDSRGGAATEIRRYSREDLDVFATVIVVAEESPRLWVLEDSEEFAEFLGLGAPQVQVVSRGDSDCLERLLVYPRADEEIDPDDVAVISCQHSAHGATVVVQFTGGEALTQDEAFDLTDAVVAAVR